MIVHDASLIVRAPGYVSADSALGAAVLGHRLGDLVQVDSRVGSRTYVVQTIRRVSRQSNLHQLFG
jgi:transcription elongation GreA/GreB family factor